VAQQPSLFRRQQLEGIETEVQCWRLYIDHGWSVRRIGEELSIAPATVSRALRRGEKRALEQLTASVTGHKMRAMERLERLYQIAMDAYANSVGEARTRKRKKTREVEGVPVQAIPGGPLIPVRGEGSFTESEVMVDDTKPGNPRFLSEARAAVADMRKLLGLDAPTKVAFTDPDRPHLDLSDDDVRRELAKAMKDAGVDLTTLAQDTNGNPHEVH
jgi:hypothetical protein